LWEKRCQSRKVKERRRNPCPPLEKNTRGERKNQECDQKNAVRGRGGPGTRLPLVVDGQRKKKKKVKISFGGLKRRKLTEKQVARKLQ